MPYYQARNEQAHGARRGRRTPGCATGCRRSPARRRSARARPTWSPARRCATINRLPVLLLPGDIFATRVADPVLQQLEDAARPTTSRSTTLPAGVAVLRPGQPARAAARRRCSRAMRVLTDPAETGAVTLALPQDVQAEAFDWPDEFFADRGSGTCAGPVPEPAALARAVAAIRAARAAADRRRRRRHLLRGRPRRCAAFAEATGIPVGETQAGKGSLPYDHPPALGAIGATGTTAANRARPRGRPGHRHRHPLQRLHHRVAHRVRRPGRALRQHQRRRVRRGQARPAAAVVADARAGARRRSTTRSPAGGRRPDYRARDAHG